MILNQSRPASNDSALVDPVEIAATLSVLHPAGSTFEIRGIGIQERGSDWTNTLAGYFSDPEAAARAVAGVNYVRGAFYVTLQAVKPEIISRCADRLNQQRGKGDDLTKDKDVIAYQWIPLDCDTERSTGIMASEAERHAAEVMAAEIAYDLEREGWGRPLLADSGSGRHADYKTHLPMFAKGENLIQDLLEALQHHYGTEAAKIDRSVFNPARVWRLYGTWNRKGDDDAKRGRPHRRSCILERPDEFVTITRPMIDHIIAKHKPKTTVSMATTRNAGSTSNGKSWSVDDVSRWLDTYLRPAGISIAEPTSKGTTTQWELTPCPMTNDHGSSYAAAVSRDASGVLGFKCFGERCNSYRWKDLRAKYEIGAYDKQSAAVDLDGIMGQVTNGPQATGDEHIDDDDDEPLDAPAGPFPAECLRPEGLLAEIVDYNLATAIVPQPELALAGALALFATVSGRKVRDKRNTRTNLYVLGVDRTANGKEHARSVNKSLMAAAGADDMLGGERIASHAGIVSAVYDSHACLLQLDEMGRFLATTKEAGKSPHLYAVPTLLLELFTSSGTLWKADSYADKSRNRVINQPHLCLYGTSTPSTFWGNLSTSNIRDGLIGRFSVFEGRGDKSEYRPDTDATRPIPTALIDALKCWVNYRSLGNLSDENPDPQIVPYSPEADRRWQDHARQIFERRKTEPEMRSDLWGRTAEKTAKLALIAACSRAGIDVQEITLADVEWAIRLSNWTTRNVIAKCLEEVSENAQEGKVKRMLRSIGPTGLSLSAFNRLNRFLPSRERDEILRDLIGNGDVVIQEKATKGRKGRKLFRGGRRS